MKDPLSYTYDGLERELNLLEIHLKEAPEGDEAFCQDCIDKHISTCRGYALEGPGFTKNKKEQKNFLKIEKQIKEMKGQDYKEKGVELSQKVRELRKKLIEECPNCKTLSKSEIENLTKDLNTQNPFNILANEKHTHNSEAELNLEKDNMISMKAISPLLPISGGQALAEGVRWAGDRFVPGYANYVSMGGGAVIAVLGTKLKQPLKTIAMVTGTNLLVDGIFKLVRGVVTPVPAVAAVSANQGYAGKAFSYAPSFGGPTFAGKVSASNIPTQYARAGILAGAQAFEAPEHADLIRVD